MKRIAIDMDGVMADYDHRMIEEMNQRFNMSLTKKDLLGKHINSLFPELKEEIYQFINTYDFFRYLPVMKDAQETILELSEHYEIMIATAAMEAPGSFAAKYEWLHEHFPFLNSQAFVFCGNKSTVRADYLIDDNLYQLNSFKGEGVLYSAPHNVTIDYPVRMNSWEEVKDLFLSAKPI